MSGVRFFQIHKDGKNINDGASYGHLEQACRVLTEAPNGSEVVEISALGAVIRRYSKQECQRARAGLPLAAAPAKYPGRRNIVVALSVIVPIIAILASFFVPEVRHKLGLEKSPVVTAPSKPEVSSRVGAKAALSESGPAVEPEPKTIQQSKTKVKGDNNVVGNNVSGNGNIVGNQNQVSLSPAPNVQVNNAPNGIAISGGIVNSPTVNNFGPPPLPTPTVTVCETHPTAPAAGQYLTVLTLSTNVPIPRAWYALFFDGPIGDGKAEMDGHAFGFEHTRADKMPDPEKSFLFRVISVDFGTNVWSPGAAIKVTIPSKQRVGLVKVLSGSGENGLDENLMFKCGNA
jgi:hypothetical protein